jgi:hypothetical protein
MHITLQKSAGFQRLFGVFTVREEKMSSGGVSKVLYKGKNCNHCEVLLEY